MFFINRENIGKFNIFLTNILLMSSGKSFGDLHKSVLLEELVNSIEIYNDKRNVIIDATLGLAGHAIKIVENLNSGDVFVGFDADSKNLELAKQRLKNTNKKEGVEIIFINSNFVNLKQELENIGINSITGIYYDLGISSLHIDEAERGFSFRLDGPLDMRFDKTKGRTAADVVNSYRKEDLRKFFLEYGEESYCTKIASKIVEERKHNKFKTTKDLSDLIGKISRVPKSKNRIFQALRIEVNNELENIKTSLENAIELLEKEGIIFVISFHSLEDRIVKNIFKKESRDCICRDLICSCKHTKTLKKLNKKPILPTKQEIKNNSRSRSAKARKAKKIV